MLVIGLGSLNRNRGNLGETANQPGASGQLLFYCAAGLKSAVQPLVEEYTRRYDADVQVQFAGSGTLLSNLQVAQLGDLYLAGDSSYLEIAREKGAVDEPPPEHSI